MKGVITLVVFLAGLLVLTSGPHAMGAEGPPPRMGFNWDNAATVYVLHWDERSISASDPSLPLRTARENNVGLVRVFVGTPEVIARWRADRTGTLADIRRMLDDARGNGVKLILSNYLTKATIEALAGTTFPDWASAQRYLETPGSSGYNAFRDWLSTLASNFRDHPAIYSFEVTNEPGWMLGFDSGAVSKDQVADFLGTMFRALKQAGAGRTNLGGSPFDTMTDDELRRAVESCDVLDMHFYPDPGPDGKPLGTNGGILLSTLQGLVNRVRNLTGRDRPAMVGEVGTLPWGWFADVSHAALARGWIVLAWGYDGWDNFWFNEDHRPEVLAYLKSTNQPPPYPPQRGPPHALPIPAASLPWSPPPVESRRDIPGNSTAFPPDLNRPLALVVFSLGWLNLQGARVLQGRKILRILLAIPVLRNP